MRARRVLLLALYGLGVVAFVEGSLRLAFASDAFFRRVAADDDASWRLAWVRSRAHHGGDYAGVDAYSPTRGWSPRPDLRDVPLHGGRVSTNARGLRGRREYGYAKPPGTRRIVVLGDSFTFGEEVDDGETFPARLADELPGVEVLNLGVHGYGHDQMLLYLEEEGLRYEPDAVLLGFVGVDVVRDTLSFRDSRSRASSSTAGRSRCGTPRSRAPRASSRRRPGARACSTSSPCCASASGS